MRRALAIAALALAASAGPAPAQGQTRAQGKPAASRQAQFAKLPYWGGYWLTENDETSIGGLAERSLQARATGASQPRPVMSLFGFNAPWNEEGKKRNTQRIQAGGRKAEGWGYPMMMNAAAPLQFIITPEEVLIINAYRDVRHIYTDGREHPAAEDMWPTVWGESIGHWEGDTLVIDTVQVKNPNYFFHGSPPLSEDAHYVERIRKVGDRIVAEFTITDPTTLAEPWKSTVTYQPAEGFDRMISIDFDNDRTGNDAAGQNTIEPPKDGQ